jgi:phosphoenolpyruvate carboxykinase (GTP)
VYLGATMGSETTAAITGTVGVIRRDPMAMLAFIGYDAGTYFEHWLSMFDRIARPPKLFLVNWFRRGGDGKYLWPGFGENMRVLKWILDRCAGRAGARESPVGLIPRESDLELRGLDTDRARIAASLQVDPAEWRRELDAHGEWLDRLGDTVPEALGLQRRLLLASLKADLTN